MSADQSTAQGTFWGDDEPRKRCTRCREVKPYTQFYWRPDRRCRRARCKTCVQKDHAQRRKENPNLETRSQQKRRLKVLGLTEKDYQSILAKQNGCCDICGRQETCEVRGKLRRLAVDHNHSTGAVRGLLCGMCNRMLGHAQDSPELLLRAIAYLEKHQGNGQKEQP